MMAARTLPSVLVALFAACAATPSVAGRRHVGPVTHVAWHGDTLLATSQAGVSLRTRSGEEVWRVPPLRAFAALAISERQTLVVGGTPGRSGELAVLQHDQVLTYRHLGLDTLDDAAGAADGSLVAIASVTGHVHLLDLPNLTDRATWCDHTAACRAVAFTADARHLLSAGLDGVVVVRPLPAGDALRLTDHTAGVECLAVAPDQRRCASGARDGKLRVHDLTGRLRHTFARLGAAVLAVTWRDDDQILVGLEDGRVLRLDLLTDARHELTCVTGPVFALAQHPDGALAVGRLGNAEVLPPDAVR